jgi:alcohol dehydrogenase class IV
MQLAAFSSGVTLANAGLGTVHGMASVIGSRSSIPHGIICSALMYPVNVTTIGKLRQGNGSTSALAKYARVGQLFTTQQDRSEAYYVDFLLDTILSLKTELQIPNLAAFGATEGDVVDISTRSENKANPVTLDKEEIGKAFINAL